MLRQFSVATIGLGLLSCGLALVRADDKEKATADKKPAAKAADAASDADPEAFLKSKGLKRLEPYFLLPEEPEMSKKMSGLDKLKRAVIDGQKLEAKAEKLQAEKEAAKDNMTKRRIQLRPLLQEAKTAEIHNRIANEMNQLYDQTTLLAKDIAESTQLKTAQAAANKAREAYVQQILEIRQLDDRLREKYADLAADPKVVESIEAYNKAKDKKYKLGPSATLTANDHRLKKFEEIVLSDSIDIHRTQGELWEISVVFNGKNPQIIDLDTGASMVSLSYTTAKAAGLTPSSNDPDIQLRLADGRPVTAKLVTAGTIRVGKFELEKVPVAVMPESLTNAGSSLGQSYLKHFSYKIDTEKSKLVMTKVDAIPIAGAVKSK